MKNSLATMRALFCLIAAMLLLVGCDEPDKTAAQPQTVRKKITAKAETGPPAATAAAAAPAQPAPCSRRGRETGFGSSGQAADASIGSRAATRTEGAAADPSAEPPGESGAGCAPAAVPGRNRDRIIRRQPAPSRCAPDGSPQQSGMAGADSQIAALLNIQAPPPYNPKGKVDPFEPLLRDESAAAAVAKLTAKADPDRPKTPLEKIDLGQLKLVAIITALGGNRALVEESSGKGYIIKEGTYIGLNSGKVVGIKADKVLVEEEFEDIYGKSVTQKKEITLPKPPGEL